jgi:phosphoglycerate dehydrogenase-like enzyme
MARPAHVEFLDDDHVLRILRLFLSHGDRDPRVPGFFAPEDVDLAQISRAATGLRRADGAEIALASAQGAQSDADILIFRRGQITKELLERYPRLKLVQRLGERADGIDVAAATARGVWVSCFPRLTVRLTAEHAILLMLALAKRLLRADSDLRKGTYSSLRTAVDDVCFNWVGLPAPGGLFGTTVGIVGLGEIGSVVGQIAHACGASVLYHNRQRASPHRESVTAARYVALADLLAHSDFVSLHITGSPENANLADDAFFAAMKSTAYFINTSRGGLVNEDSLYKALKAGTIAGAGLDVHRPEPRAPNDRFAALSNVVLTPHIAGGTRSGVLQEFDVILRNCRAVMEGRPPSFRVDKP